MATSTAPITIPQINRYYYAGEAMLATIQQAVNFAIADGNAGTVVVPQGYTGTDSITAVTGGSASVYIMDERGGQRRGFVWYQNAYIEEPILPIGIGTPQINTELFIGPLGKFHTIQAAINYAVALGYKFQITISGTYSGSEDIEDLIGGASTVYLSDQRTPQWQNYQWNGTKYIPADFVPLGNVIADVITADVITAQGATFSECIVDHSPVRTFANTADGGGEGMVWPDIGIAVSLGDEWLSPSLDPETLVQYDADNNVALEGNFSFQGPIYLPDVIDLNTVMIGGLYHWDGYNAGAVITNNPPIYNGDIRSLTLQVFPEPNRRSITQIAWGGNDPDQTTFKRRFQWGSQWEGWRAIINDDGSGNVNIRGAMNVNAGLNVVGDVTGRSVHALSGSAAPATPNSMWMDFATGTGRLVTTGPSPATFAGMQFVGIDSTAENFTTFATLATNGLTTSGLFLPWGYFAADGWRGGIAVRSAPGGDDLNNMTGGGYWFAAGASAIPNAPPGSDQRGYFVMAMNAGQGNIVQLAFNFNVDGDVWVRSQMWGAWQSWFRIQTSTSFAAEPQSARGEGQVEDGETVIELPVAFATATETAQKTIMLTPITEEDEPIAQLAVERIDSKRFRVRASGNPEQRFFWEVRSSQPSPEPLPEKPHRPRKNGKSERSKSR